MRITGWYGLRLDGCLFRRQFKKNENLLMKKFENQTQPIIIRENKQCYKCGRSIPSGMNKHLNICKGKKLTSYAIYVHFRYFFV